MVTLKYNMCDAAVDLSGRHAMNFIFQKGDLSYLVLCILSNMLFSSSFFSSLSFSFVCWNLPLYTQLTTELFGDMMGEDVTPKDVFLAFTVDPGGNMVNACVMLGVAVIKCNATASTPSPCGH